MNKFLKLAYDHGCKQAALDYAELLPLVGAAAGGYAGSQSEDSPVAGTLLGALGGGAAGYGARGLGRGLVADAARDMAHTARGAFEYDIRHEAPHGIYDALKKEHEVDQMRLLHHATEMDPVDASIAARLRDTAAKRGPGKELFTNDYAKRLQESFEAKAPRQRFLDEELVNGPARAEKLRVGALGAGLLGAGGLTASGLED